MKKFIIIKTEKQGFFISDNIENKGYFNSEIPKLKFDEKVLERSFKENWYKIDNLPTKVTSQEPCKYINLRYELKAGYPVSELTPQTISKEDWDSDSDVSGLYNYVSDKIEGDWVDTEFEYELIEVGKIFEGKPKYPFTNTLIDQLYTHSINLTQKPCSISGKDFYKIVREYIKTNINGEYARITSDYDFCFTVQKVIKLHERKPLTIYRGTKRRPNLVTNYKVDKLVIVFESSPEGYSNYPVQQGITAANYEELEQKIEEYLKNLIEEINKPLKECPYCKGSGVILTNEKVV